jgi:hypothetical protein
MCSIVKTILSERKSSKSRITIFWNQRPYGLVELYRLLGRMHCLHLQSYRGNSRQSAQQTEEEIIKFLRNIGKLLVSYTVSHSRRYMISYSPP